MFALNLMEILKITICNIKHTQNTHNTLDFIFFKNQYFQKLDIQKNQRFMLTCMAQVIFVQVL